MHYPYERNGCYRHNVLARAESAKYKHCYRHERYARKRSYGRGFLYKERKQIYSYADKEQPPVHIKPYARRYRNGLATLKAEEYGEAMPRKAGYRRRGRSGFAGHNAAQPHYEHNLCHVQQQRAAARNRSEHARNVGRARVFAAAFSNVALQNILGNNYSRIDRAYNIAQHCGRNMQ